MIPATQGTLVIGGISKGEALAARIMKAILKKIYHTPVIKKAVINLVSIFHPPPYRRELMEFEFGVWPGIAAIRCENKRQLGENNTCPAFYREYVPTVYHKSNFDGSRAGCMMNMTALHGVMNQWRDALILIGAIRHCYVKRFGVTYNELRPADLFVVAKICAALPAFLARRFRNPMRDGEISASVAAEYKITAGVFMLLRKMMENGIRWTETDEPISAEMLYKYADTHNVLISSSGHACGGSKRKIIELIDFMIKGKADEKDLAKGMSHLADLVSDIDVFIEYSIRALTLEILMALCRSMAANAFLGIDLNFLQAGEHKKLGEDHARILAQIRKMFPANIRLDCQVEVLCGLLEKLGDGELGVELKSRVDENGHESMAKLVKRIRHLPDGYRVALADAVRQYREILDFLCERGGMLQEKIFSTLGRAKSVQLSLDDAERSLDIVSRRRFEKIVGFEMNDWRTSRQDLIQ